MWNTQSEKHIVRYLQVLAIELEESFVAYRGPQYASLAVCDSYDVLGGLALFHARLWEDLVPTALALRTGCRREDHIFPSEPDLIPVMVFSYAELTVF